MSGRLNASMFAACRERNAANASMFADASSGKTTLFLYRRKAFLANFSPSAINFGAWRRGSSTPSSELRSELDANEIYEDLATGRPLPFLRVGQRPSQTSSFGSMRTSTGCRGNGGGKTVLPFILSPVPHSRYAAVVTKPTRNIPSTPEIFWPPKTADPP